MSIKFVPQPIPRAQPVETSSRSTEQIPESASFAQDLAEALTRPAHSPQGDLGAEAATTLLRLEMMRQTLSMDAPVKETAAQGLPQTLSAVLQHYGSTEALSAPGTSPVNGIVAQAASRYRLSPKLLHAVIRAESDYDPRAVSAAGAQGLMQLMPATAKALGVKDPFDPEQNIMGGARYLRQLLDRYQGNLDAALAAYNWGPGNVDHGRHPLPRETRQYLARIKTYLGENA